MPPRHRRILIWPCPLTARTLNPAEGLRAFQFQFSLRNEGVTSAHANSLRERYSQDRTRAEGRVGGSGANDAVRSTTLGAELAEVVDGQAEGGSGAVRGSPLRPRSHHPMRALVSSR